jgi:phosphoribosylglycinamide formyltransferase-1
MTTMKLGFLASHGGSNMQAIIDACKDGRLDAKPCVVISNNPASAALLRAKTEGISGCHLSSVTHPVPDALDERIKGTLQEHSVDVVILAGYMKKIGPKTLDAFRGRILNIHPALLPKHGGKGMYGRRVHEAVLASGDRITGVTVHVIDEEYDTGPIVAQCEVEVRPGDTVETLSERVLEREHSFYVETLQRIAAGQLKLGGNR